MYTLVNQSIQSHNTLNRQHTAIETLAIGIDILDTEEIREENVLVAGLLHRGSLHTRTHGTKQVAVVAETLEPFFFSLSSPTVTRYPHPARPSTPYRSL